MKAWHGGYGARRQALCLAGAARVVRCGLRATESPGLVACSSGCPARCRVVGAQSGTVEAPFLKVKEVLYEWEQLNKDKPFWMCKSEDVMNEYAPFCTSLSNAVKHFGVVSQFVFRAFSVGPCRARFDLFESRKDSNMICYLKVAQSVFLEERRLSNSVKMHSEFIGFPIVLYAEKSKKKEVTNSVGEEEA